MARMPSLVESSVASSRARAAFASVNSCVRPSSVRLVVPSFWVAAASARRASASSCAKRLTRSARPAAWAAGCLSGFDPTEFAWAMEDTFVLEALPRAMPHQIMRTAFLLKAISYPVLGQSRIQRSQQIAHARLQIGDQWLDLLCPLAFTQCGFHRGGALLDQRGAHVARHGLGRVRQAFGRRRVTSGQG